jgi:hypothetical protein
MVQEAQGEGHLAATQIVVMMYFVWVRKSSESMGISIAIYLQKTKHNMATEWFGCSNF